jgi:hypothetical protein
MTVEGLGGAVKLKPSQDAGSSRSCWLLLAIFLLVLTPVFSVPVFPTIDFYNHLARYFVLAQIDHNAFLAANYVARWSILPNIGLDVLGAGMMRLADPMLVARVIVVVVFATQYFGLVFFNRRLTGRTSPFVALMSVPLLYSFIFTWGFANFLLGLGLVFWAAGFWLALREKPLVASIVGCLCAILIFLTHGVAFALYGLLIGALEIGLFFARGFARIGRLIRGLALLAIQAIVPALLFSLSATATGSGGISNAGASVRHMVRTGPLLRRLHDLVGCRRETIFRVAETPSATLDAVSFVVVIAILGVLIAKGRVQIVKAAWPAVIVGLLLVLLVPPVLFDVAYIADRMPLFLSFVVVGTLAWRWRGDRTDKLTAGLLIGIVALRMIYIGVQWQDYRQDLTAFQSAAQAIPPGSVVAYVDAGKTGRLRDGRRCDMYGPLLVAEHRDAAPLFAVKWQQPLQLSGPLQDAVLGLSMVRHTFRRPTFNDDLIAAAVTQRRFGYVMICDADRLLRPTPGTMVNHTGRFTVLRTGG